MPKCPKCNMRYVHERCFNCYPVAQPPVEWNSCKIKSPWSTPDWADTLPKDCPPLGFSHEEVWCRDPGTDMTYMYCRLRPDQICYEYGFEEFTIAGEIEALVKEDEEGEGVYVLTGLHHYANLPPDGTGFHLQYQPKLGHPPLWRYWYDFLADEGEAHWRVGEEEPLEETPEDRDATPMELACVAMDELDERGLLQLKTLLQQRIDDLAQEKLRAELPDRLAKAKYEGAGAFWGAVAKQFPEATTGDIAPSEDLAFDDAIDRAIDHWVDLNVLAEDN